MLRFVFILMMASCGNDPTVVEKEVPVQPPSPPPAPPPAPPPPVPGGQLSYAQMTGYINQYCIKCHQGDKFTESEDLLKRSRVLQELTTRNMPPNQAALPEEVRTSMVNYFR